MKDNRMVEDDFSSMVSTNDKYDMIQSIRDGLYLIFENSDLSDHEKREYNKLANEVFDTMATIKILRREYTDEIVENKRSINDLTMLKSIIDRLDVRCCKMSCKLINIIRRKCY